MKSTNESIYAGRMTQVTHKWLTDTDFLQKTVKRNKTSKLWAHRVASFGYLTCSAVNMGLFSSRENRTLNSAISCTLLSEISITVWILFFAFSVLFLLTRAGQSNLGNRQKAQTPQKHILNNYAVITHESSWKNTLFALLHVYLHCLILPSIFHSGLSALNFVSRYWSKVSFSISPLAKGEPWIGNMIPLMLWGDICRHTVC